MADPFLNTIIIIIIVVIIIVIDIIIHYEFNFPIILYGLYVNFYKLSYNKGFNSFFIISYDLIIQVSISLCL